MGQWFLIWLAACDAPTEEPAEPIEVQAPKGEVAGEPVQLRPGGPTLQPRRGGPLFNSKPDHPVTRVASRRHEGHELFMDGEPLGRLPVTVPIKVGTHTFEVLVGPGDRLAFERKIIAKPGILLVELGELIAALLVACAGDDPTPPGDGPPQETGGTGTPGIVASCDVEGDNELRLLCRIDLPDMGPASVTVAPEDGSEPERVFASSADDSDHDIVVWDLVGDTAYRWQVASGAAQGPSGTVRTGVGPPGMSLPVEIVKPGPSSIERLLLPWSCGGDGMLVVIDAKGVLRWYDGSFSPVSLNGLTASERGFSTLSGRSRLTEIARDGTVLRALSEGDFPHPVHHDIASSGDAMWVLYATLEPFPDGLDYVVDGLFTVDPEARVDDVWSVDDVLDPQGLPEPPGSYWASTYGSGVDFGHANAIDVDDRGMWLVSFKHLDTVMAIVGDPASPDYGSIAWTLVGGELGVMPSTLTLLSSTGVDASFEYQHHAQWTDQGVRLFDNRRQGPSRVLDIVLDEGAGTADVVRELRLAEHCPVQSSAYGMADGTTVVACSANRHVYEFDDQGELRREVSIRCDSPSALVSPMIKAIPVSL